MLFSLSTEIGIVSRSDAHGKRLSVVVFHCYFGLFIFTSFTSRSPTAVKLKQRGFTGALDLTASGLTPETKTSTVTSRVDVRNWNAQCSDAVRFSFAE